MEYFGSFLTIKGPLTSSSIDGVTFMTSIEMFKFWVLSVPGWGGGPTFSFQTIIDVFLILDLELSLIFFRSDVSKGLSKLLLPWCCQELAARSSCRGQGYLGGLESIFRTDGWQGLCIPYVFLINICNKCILILPKFLVKMHGFFFVILEKEILSFHEYFSIFFAEKSGLNFVEFFFFFVGYKIDPVSSSYSAEELLFAS